MTTTVTNQIKVALIGYVSAGKTTVLNAIFRDKYGEVSMRRTTAAVNYFRISPSLNKTQQKQASKQARESESNHQWSLSPDDDPRTPKDVLKEITKDNATLRTSSTVHERHFDIELEETLFEMHDNTKLVLVDIPGINEAGTSSKYKDYVCEKWHTFDCVVVVMDGRQGVNTDEQMHLLQLVKENQANRELPVIILFNKIDVPEDVEQQMLVEEAREAIENEFNVASSQEMLKQVLSVKKESMDASKPDLLQSLFAPKKANAKTPLLKKAYPLFITISAVHAFIYQSASIMSFEDFQKFDYDLIERFGRDYFGRKWRQLDKSKKYAEAYKALKDPEECKVGLELSNFDKFLAALDYTVGGKQRQLSLLRTKLEDATMRLSGNETLVGDLEQIVLQRKSLKLDGEVDDLHSKFWSLLEDAETGAFVEFENPTKVGSLAVPMTLLIEYHGLCMKCGWRNQCDFVVCRMKKLLRRQLNVILKKRAKCWNLQSWQNRHSRDDVSKWEDLSPKGWETLLSLTLLIDERPFRMDFGYEKIALESMLYQCRSHLQNVRDLTFCPSCKMEMQVKCKGCNRQQYMSSHQSCPTTSCRALDPKCYHCVSCQEYFYATQAAASSGICCSCGHGLGSKFNCQSCGVKVRKDVIGITFESAGGLHYKDGVWTPVCPELYNRLNGIPIPKGRVSDPHHFGHLLWQFCNFMEDGKK